MRTVATIEARMGSTRLPGKVLEPIEGKPLLQHVIERVRGASSLERVVVATTTSHQDDAIDALAQRLGASCFRGSEEDVMGRVLGAARAFEADDLVALTGDNPLVDPRLIDDVVAFYRAGEFDYVTTTHMHHSKNWKADRTFPVGISVQVMAVQVLADAAARTADPGERQYTSFVIYNRPERYRLGAFEASGKYRDWRHPELRLTVDTPEDLALMRELFAALYRRDPLFDTGEAVRLVAGDARLQAINQHVSQRLVHQQLLRSN